MAGQTPHPPNPNADDRFIDTMRFVESRSKEMLYFEEFLRKKHVGTRLVTQLIPRNMRRRAMSHCRVRIPSRIRDKAKSGFTKGVKKIKKFRPRKTGRKSLFRASSDLLEIKRHNNLHPAQRVLETHSFHAKRMVMGVRGGVRVATEAYQKQHRTAYKFSLTHAVLIDKSCSRMYAVAGLSPTQATAVERFCGSFGPYCQWIPTGEHQGMAILDSHMEADWTLFGGEIGLAGEQVEQVEAGLNLFELWGPSGLAVFARAMKHLGVAEGSGRVDLQLMAAGLKPSQFPSDYSAVFEVNTQSRTQISEPFAVRSQTPPLLDPVALVGFLNSHRANPGLSKEIAEEGRRIDRQLKMLADSGAENVRLTQKELFESSRPKIFLRVELVKPPVAGRTLERVQLVCSGGAGNLIFRALAKNKAKVIGHSELDFVLENHSVSVFPRDHPGTKAFEALGGRVEASRVRKYLAFPDNKKFDYFSNSFPFPFELGFPSESPQDLGVFRFQVLGTGNVGANALVFLPSEADLASLVRAYPTADPLWADILNFQPADALRIREERVQSDHSFDRIEDYRLFLRENVVCSRQPVGKVLGGRFSYFSGRNAGTLVARREVLQKALADQATFFGGKTVRGERVVLLRNHNSFDYHWGVLNQQ